MVDLGCGTGNYLQAQIEAFGNLVHWVGIDRSEAMLDQARAKELDAELLLADAAELPLRDASVDFVKIRFAHHHFADKAAAFREVRRVLKPGGVLSLFNVAHEYSRRAWVYHYFPQTRNLDEERFPSVLAVLERDAETQTHFVGDVALLHGTARC